MRKFSKVISMILIVMILVTNVAFAEEIDINEYIHGALLGDLETGEIMYSYNINEAMPIASISKLMTYLVMMDHVSSGKITLEDNVLISERAADTEGSRLGIVKGETVKLRVLVDGLLVLSGNDAAAAIAEYVAGTQEEFVVMMNNKANELGLISARFINTHGLPIDDKETDQNFMSIEDIYKMVRHIIKTYPDVLNVTSQKQLTIPERKLNKKNSNPLVDVMPGVDGLKTGYTIKAGLCLVSTMPVTSSNGENFRLINIVMGAQSHEDRLEKAETLMEYGLNNFSYQKLSDKTAYSDQVYIPSSKDGKVDVYPSDDFYKIIKNGETIRTEIKYNEKVEAPLSQGDKIGTISYFAGDEQIGQVDAVVNQEVKKANIFVQFGRFIGDLFGF